MTSAAYAAAERMRRLALLSDGVDLSFINPDLEETLMGLFLEARTRLQEGAGAAEVEALAAAPLAQAIALIREEREAHHVVQAAELVLSRVRPPLLRRLQELLNPELLSLDDALRAMVRISPFRKSGAPEIAAAARCLGEVLAPASEHGAALALLPLSTEDARAVASFLKAALDAAAMDPAPAVLWRRAALALARQRADAERAAKGAARDPAKKKEGGREIRAKRDRFLRAASGRRLSPYESRIVKALAAVFPEEIALAIVSFLCRHPCALTSIDTCCVCADLRKYAATYEKYVDGVGFVETASRSEFYCPPCRSRMEEGDGEGEGHARHNFHLVASLDEDEGAPGGEGPPGLMFSES
eukprot:tig00021621_g22971.t1